MLTCSTSLLLLIEDVNKDLASAIAMDVNDIKDVSNKIEVRADYKPFYSITIFSQIGKLMTTFTYAQKIAHWLTSGTSLIALLAGFLFLTACASTPPPTKEISAAEQSMVDAEQARVAQYALSELQEARSKLAAARTAVLNEQMEDAKRLAVEASAGIKFASAKAELAKAEAVNADMQKNIRVLKEEMQRTSGEQQ
jgi:hypothetical protein